MALRPAFSAAIWAANGVDLREPLKPCWPDDDQAIVVPFCLTNALEGFRNIDPELEEMGASFSRSRLRRFTRVTLPLVMPFLAAGLRISFGICWKIALVAELFGAQSGLGYLMLQAQSTANAAMVFACCFVIVIVVFAVDRLLLAPLARAYSKNQGVAS
jgi:NitT/TauT family transport system permease protein/sulfonate transport system permease protein